MSQVKVSDLPAASGLSTSDPVIVNQSGVTRRTTAGAFTDTMTGFTAAGTGAGARTVQAKAREVVSITDFENSSGNQVATTQADNAVGINRALASGAGLVWGPAGTYDHSAVLTPAANQTLCGQGQNGTIFRQTGAAANGIDIVDKSWVTVRDLQVTNNSGAATGYGIRVQGGGNNKLQNVRADNFGEGIRLASTSPVTLDTAYITGCVSYGLRVMSVGVACTGVTLKDILSTTNTGTGIFIDGLVNGVYGNTVETANNTASGLLVDDNADGDPSEIFLDKLVSDSNGAYGIRIQDANTLRFSEHWSSNRGTNKNFEIVSTATNVTIFGGAVYDCNGHGIEAAGNRVSVIGTVIQNAGRNTADTYDGIYVTGANFVGVGVHVFSGNSGANDKTRYGVNFDTGATDYTLVGGDCSDVFNATKVNDTAAHTGGTIIGVNGANEATTFTPTVSGDGTAGAGTYSVQVGRYKRVGKTVFFSATIVWSAHTGTGNLLISNLPFTAANVTNLNPPVQFHAYALAMTKTFLSAWVAGNSTNIQVWERTAAEANPVQVALPTSGNIQVTGMYFID